MCAVKEFSAFFFFFRKIPWREGIATAVLLPGESSGQKSLVGPWGPRDWDIIEVTEQECMGWCQSLGSL